jgi:hypothetical protein
MNSVVDRMRFLRLARFRVCRVVGVGFVQDLLDSFPHSLLDDRFDLLLVHARTFTQYAYSG